MNIIFNGVNYTVVCMYTTSPLKCELSFCVHPPTGVAELLQMKSEMDKLRQQLEYKNRVREGRTTEERQTHTRADVRTSSTSDVKREKHMIKILSKCSIS